MKYRPHKFDNDGRCKRCGMEEEDHFQYCEECEMVMTQGLEHSCVGDKKGFTDPDELLK